MNSKLDYITRVFQKTSSKRYENYVITRLWHQLNDDEIKLVPQQFVERNQEQYALTDIYFPQIGLHVEINEPIHYGSEERIAFDANRRSEIINKTNHEVEAIDCRKSVPEIHLDIERLVEIIKNRVDEQKKSNLFNPWNPEHEFSPFYFQNKGYLDCGQDVNLRTVDDICILFGVNPKIIYRGFLRKGVVEHPSLENVLIWWPSENNKSGGWRNSVNSEKDKIFETNTDKEKRNGHIYHLLNSEKRTTRLVFYKYRDTLGYNFYKFFGVYELDRVESKEDEGVVWRKMQDIFQLNQAE